MSIVKTLIVNADAKCRYLSPATSIRAMKAVTTTLLSAKDGCEVSTYFDYLIRSFNRLPEPIL